MNGDAFARDERYARACLDGDGAHDFEHVRRVVTLARRIAREEPSADMDVVITAAILHDIGRPAQVKDPTLDHAQVGAGMAYEYLKSEGRTEQFCAHVRDCIRCHRYRTGDPPATIEAKILFDADKLDVCGAMGIARTLIFAGKTDCPLYPVRDGKPVLFESEGEDTFFTEYNQKLSRVGGVFFTEMGRRLAEKRADSARAFVEALRGEILDACDEGAIDAV